MTGRRRLRMLLAGGAGAAVVVYAGAASAYWSAGGSGTGAASTDTLPAGGTPTATVAGGTTVTVSFGRAVTPAGHDVTSYAVRRYAAPTGGTATAAFTCSWPSAGAPSCVETGVPAGVWYYTDTPLAGSSWVGTESARSNGAATDSTAPTIAVTSITPPPNGNGYHDSSPVTVNLAATDNAGGAGVASITYWVDAGTHTTVIATTAAVSVAGDGAHSVSYFATDNAGNASATSTQTVRIDTVAPGVATVGSYPNPVNLANRASVAVSGSAEAAATVTLTIADAGGAHTVTATTTANGFGAWSVAGIDVTALNDGTVTYRATATDAAGNSGPVGTATASKDTVAPTVAIGAVTDPISTGNAAAAGASGTVESGASVALAVTDGTPSHTIRPSVSVNGGSWTVTGVNLSTLTDGTIGYTATATDPAGNSATASRTATKDTTAPAVTALAVGPAANASTGQIRKSGSYYVYANATDTAPGTVATVTANVGNLTGGATAVALTGTGGPFSAGGVTYAYRSAAQTAGSGLTNGSKTFTATATDAAGNTSGAATGSLNVDGTAPSPAGVTLGNHTGGLAGKPETGDTITFTFSEEMDPGTLYAGWGWGITPDVTNAVITFNDNTGGNGTNQPDSLTVTGPSGVSLGTVTNLEGHLVTAKQRSYTFGATVQYAVTGGQSVVTVTLGGVTAGASGIGTAGSSTFTWAAASTTTDLATNPIGSTANTVDRTATPF